ncbi:Alpha/Beta hydrolase protein [Phascolomyces articulosus]|uniref:Alpha/Beta hydrolase protein n=1 Tax=Phascolomyces articulosus TaxID=60185 RepID=A0AAD5K4P2_9FUNG|nr:Alpha/Beta hydrolase protein [Phascolomyces articulosus]
MNSPIKATITGRTVAIAVSLATVAGAIYLYQDPRHCRRRFLSRLWFILCKRDLAEAKLERQLIKEPEPDIITNHTQYVEINGHRLRIVHIIHELGSRVPLIVFIHGLGGQVSQWQNQIEYFSQTAHVLAIDLLGCGKSELSYDWESYTTDSLSKDVISLLTERYQSSATVIIAHAYGCSIASNVAASPKVQPILRGLVLISPKARIEEQQVKSKRTLRWIPDWMFEMARTADRKGGLHSKSVERFLGYDVEDRLRRDQLRWSLLNRPSAYKRFVYGASFPTRQTYRAIGTGVLLISGSEDKVTPPNDVNVIRNFLLGLDPQETNWDSIPHADSIRVPEPYIIPDVGHMPMVVHPELVNPVVSDFLIKNCGLHTLSGAWQAQHRTKGENKWDLKNYEKWMRTSPITEGPIGPSLFRAMKVMRQTDTNHSPSGFLAKYPEIGFIIDISNDTPPYRSSDFEDSRVEYIKLRTVSKIPPEKDDVAKFIEIASECWERRPTAQIAVHCHYGFNRTGFFICCYMIEKLGVSVPDALRYFGDARPPGIRHSHFVDELYLRYVLPHQRGS